MNRAVLVVLIDFLMISLVTLFNSNQSMVQAPKPETGSGTGVEVQAVQDMLEVLQEALAQEQLARGQMSNQLSRAEQQLQARQEDLAARDQMIQQAQQNMREAEARAKELAAERAKLQAAQNATQQQLAQVQTQQATTQAALQKVQQELQTATAEASSSRNATEAVQTELAARRAEVQKLQDQLAKLQETALSAQIEKGRLATNLTRIETEAALFRAQLDEKREQIVALSQEKAQLSQEKAQIQEHATTLAKGIDNLAQESQNLATEIHEDRQLAPNTIYKTYLDNRVDCSVRATRSGLFGIRTGDAKDSKIVLFRDNGKVYALFHIQETALPVWGGGGDWDEMTAVLARAGATVPLSGLSLVSSDPRIVVATLDEPTAKQLGVKPFEVSEDPTKFQDAVVVGGKEGYYGEVEFKLVPGLPRYLKMQRRPIGKIFGKFSPSKGDLAFSKSGDLLGMMVNSQYCALVRSMPPSRFIPLGKDIAAQRTGLIGGEISRRIQSLPPSLQ